MTIHSSTLALKIPWVEELGAGYSSWGRKQLGMTEWEKKKKNVGPVVFVSFMQGEICDEIFVCFPSDGQG